MNKHQEHHHEIHHHEHLENHTHADIRDGASGEKDDRELMMDELENRLFERAR